MILGFCIFSVLFILLELTLGFALMGGMGEKLVVQREKNPGPYWFIILFHVIIGIVLPVILMLSTG